MRWAVRICALLFVSGLGIFVLLFRLFGPGWLVDPRSGCKVWDADPRRGISIRWDGPCTDGKANGYGRLQVFRNGKFSHLYEANFAGGHIGRHGTVRWSAANNSNGLRYEGDLAEGALTGHGVYFFADGSRYEGAVASGTIIGRGTYFYADGSRYDGGWQNNLKSGHGVKSWPNGGRYDGQWKNDLPNGTGTLTFNNGNSYSGDWRNGCFRQGTRWAIADASESDCAAQNKPSSKPAPQGGPNRTAF